ncbi:hypothetical protein GCM10009718_15840 [Isoptericola halotolerans]|uniref:Uncharacterized protein n=1 Tax=Isoptericola halotolerans TaxID=300560 RepID=A0ABX1ZYE1_9MICO|nr:hypothetical protein [Isoptericola halotolerans]NOV95496.1 hypothetical protein [Isoptericola halotolerans]
MTDDGVEVRWRFRRRTARIAGVGAGVVVLVGVWWAVSSQGVVETGSSSWSPGYRDECAYPDEDVWALYAADEDVVAVQTVRNSSPWPVEVVSDRPDVFRFGAIYDELAMFPSVDGVVPPPDGTTDRAVVPAGEEIVMWIVEPFPEDGPMPHGSEVLSGRQGIGGADVRIWSLGLPHDAHVAFHGSLWQSGLTSDSAAFQRELGEMCLVDE